MKPRKVDPKTLEITEDIMRRGKVVDSVHAVALDLTGPRKLPWFKAIERLNAIRKTT